MHGNINVKFVWGYFGIDCTDVIPDASRDYIFLKIVHIEESELKISFCKFSRAVLQWDLY
jgi:hypothetical protein